MQRRIQLDQDKIRQWIKDGKSTNWIAKKFNCNPGTIWFFCQDANIELNNKRSEHYGDTDKFVSEILKQFKQGKSAYSIAKKLPISKYTVLRILKAQGIDTGAKRKRDDTNLLKDKKDLVIQLYKDGKTQDEIGEITGHTGPSVCKILQKHGVSANQYGVDEQFFDIIDTPVKAYVLGFWYADGCVDDKGKLRIQLADKNMVFELKNVLEYEGPVYHISPPKKFPNRKDQWCLAINRKKLADQLVDKGCIPKKSLILTFPDKGVVPARLLHHFVRGYFDGDGSISIKKSKYGQVSIVGTEMFLEELGYQLKDRDIDFKIYCRHPERGTTTRQLMIWNNGNVKRFYGWIYKDCGICLEDKKQKFEQVM